ncbi:hypothetical protein OF364_01020 [Mycoplasma enhydrae]|uniref:MAG3240 family lipoprotein n=1 Tax=Mycoplasma enhydrae TaxID=2499220 RepID=UPI0021E6FC24|nr:hypothetical protein [Mycoplasma enhydrae]MCV3753397.1 hypothetical protein [Mycoplasma enhydrae]
MINKKRIFFSALSLASVINLPVVSLSCIRKKEVYLDISKISRVFLNRLSLNQIASIENDEKIFYYFENSKKHRFEGVKASDGKMFLKKRDTWIEYKPDFPVRNNWKQEISKNDNINIFDSNEKSDINNFLNDYKFEDIDEAGDFNDDWFSTLSEIYKKDFNRNDNPYFEDLQTIIFRINYDINANNSIMNKRYIKNAYTNKQALFFDWIEPQYIQSKVFLSEEFKKQRQIWINLMKLYLNRFNVGVSEIGIDWNNADPNVKSISNDTNYIKFQIKSIKDWEGKELLSESKKNTYYYINGFRNYAINGKFGIGTKGLDEKLPLFTDYIQNPLLYIDGKQYITVIDNINHFIKGSTSPEYWNTKGLMYLFNTFKNEIFKIKIPDYRKNEDLKYKIIDFKFSDYFDTNQIFKAIVRVTKKDKSTKDYVWLSSNFDDHGHRLKGLIMNNIDESKVSPQDIYSFHPNNKGIPKGISLEDFVNNSLDLPFMQALKRAANHMNISFNYWNNNSRQNFEPYLLNNDSYQIQVFNSYINNYMLAYALENKAKKTLSGIKRIDIELKPEKNKLGRLYFELKFIAFGDNDYDFKSSSEKQVAKVSLYWNNFKGYDKSIDVNDFSLIKFERTS